MKRLYYKHGIYWDKLFYDYFWHCCSIQTLGISNPNGSLVFKILIIWIGGIVVFNKWIAFREKYVN